MEFLSPHKDVVQINSLNRSSGTSSQFSIDISKQLRIPNNYDTVVLTSFSCPKSWYAFNSTNNTFIIQEGITQYTVSIPVGNYNDQSLLLTINTQIAASGVSFTYTTSEPDPSTAASTGLYTWTVSNNSSQPYFIFSSTSCYSQLGFLVGTYQFSANTLTSPNVINLQLTNSLLLYSNIVGGPNSVLSAIVPNQSDYSQILYEEQSPSLVSKPFNPIFITNATFSLNDAITGNLLDLNGLNISFTLVFYKVNDYFTRILNDKKLSLIERRFK